MHLLQNFHLVKQNATVPSPMSSTATTKVDKNNNMYKAAMEFVVEFKRKKVGKGKE